MNQHEYKECYTSRIPVGSRDVRTAVGQIVLRNVQVKIEITPGLCRSKTKLAFLPSWPDRTTAPKVDMLGGKKNPLKVLEIYAAQPWTLHPTSRGRRQRHL